MDIMIGIFGYWLIPAFLTALVLIRLSAQASGKTFREELTTQDNFVPVLLGCVWPFGLLLAGILGLMVMLERTKDTRGGYK